MLSRLSAIPLCLALCVCCAQDIIPTADLELWSPNEDGGSAPAMNIVSDEKDQPVIRFVYDQGENSNTWGNARLKSFAFQPNATALEFELYVEAAVSAAAMHLWFFEADGDAWMSRVMPEDGKGIPAILNRWRKVTLPLTQLNHQPRGDGKRQFLSTGYLLVGFNFGNQAVRIRNLRQLLSSGPAAELPREAFSPPADATGRRIAIFSQDDFPRGAGHAAPERLAALLRQRGFQPSFVTAGQLADEKTLSRKNIDLLILPQAPYFPRAAAEHFRAFLRQGGSFFSIGGYPFDALLSYNGPGQWRELPVDITAAQMDRKGDGPGTIGLNTRYGQPGDTMKLSPQQLGVCDPSYLLQHVSTLRVSPGQDIYPKTWQAAMSLDGPAAVAMTGSNNPVFPKVQARYMPLLEALDRYGRSRGPVAAAIFNHSAPWNGANWAFISASNRNLLDGSHAELDELFVSTCERLLAPAYIVHTDCDRPCARPGEKVVLTARFRLHQTLLDGLRVRVLLDGAVVHEQALPPTTPNAELIATSDSELEVPWTVPASGGADFHRYEFVLLRADRVLDRLSSGLAVWQEDSVQKGLRISQEDSYFQLNGRPCFFTGTNTTGMMWFSDNENPLVWQQDFQAMRDYAVNTLRILHFSPFCKLPGLHGHSSSDLSQRPERTQRQTDAIVQLAQINQVSVFLTLHDWLDLDLSDEDLASQQDWNAFWTSRYRDVPGMFYDIQNEPSTRLSNHVVLQPLFNQWLSEQYGSLAKAQEAWRQAGGDDAIDFAAKATVWEDLRQRDLETFRAQVFRRWVSRNRQGIKAGNHDALFTVGYLQNLNASDKFWGTEDQDFSNVHHYGALQNLRSVLKMMDRRYAGKSFSLGEFGSRAAHSARNAGQWGDPAEDSVKHFLAVGHSALGMGAAFIANWSWKDFQDCVFPWGINHADLNAKPVLQAYRNFALLCRNAEPTYAAPELYLLVPDGCRYGYRHNDIHEALRVAVDTLLTLNVPFSVINEWDLARLPEEAKTLVWPMAYGAKDETFTRVQDFVRQGGRVLFSGDVRYGYDRQASRLDRLAQLGISSPLPPVPFADTTHATAGFIASANQRVVWLPGAFELMNMQTPGALRDAYRHFLDDLAGGQRLKLNIDDGTVLAGQLPLRNGRLLTVVNMSSTLQTVVVPAQNGWPEISAEIDADRTAYLMLNPAGEVVAASAQGRLSVGGRSICSGAGDAAFVALDQRDLTLSHRVLCLPFSAGQVTLDRQANAPQLDGSIGEFRNAVWTVLAPAAPQTHSLSLQLAMDAATAYDMRLLTADSEMPQAVQTLRAMLTLQPTP